MTQTAKAAERGYTECYEADCAACTILIMVRPDTDLDGRFTAFEIECCEFVCINGWLWSFTPLH